MAMVTTQVAGKIGELYVFNELLKRGAIPCIPLVDEGVDALVRTHSGHIIEVQIKSAGAAGGKDPRWFQVAKVEPRKNLFIIGVEVRDGESGDVWVFPSAVYNVYASLPPKGSPRDLNLESGKKKHGVVLKDLLCGFRNRWELVTQYEKYEHLLEHPEDLADVLAMKDAMEAPPEEGFTLEDYLQRRAARVSN